MKFSIRGENIEVTQALREYVEKKVGRIDRYFDPEDLSDVHVTMRYVRGEGTIEVTIPTPGLLLRAEETHEDMYAAIDLVVEKLERQIRKHKTKIIRKFRNNGHATVLPKVTEPVAVLDEEEEDIQIVRTKRFSLKPMDAEEAVMQMDLLGHNFFVFQNSVTNEVNVVYRRHDGRFGLIEPK